MVVSLKANKKRIIAFVLLAVIVAGACIFLHSGGEKEKPQEISGNTNEERVAFLESFGWQVDSEPAETREVMIPAEFNDVYTTYNVMQNTQGFDLKPYAGEVCTQYKYKINNYPDEPEVYATLLVCGGIVIGGDVACAEVDGFMHGFARDSARYGETASQNSSSAGEVSSQVSQSEESSLSSQTDLESGASPVSSGVQETGTESMTSSPEEAGEESVASTDTEVIPEEAFPTD